MAEPSQAVHVRIAGRVQGVGYRQWVAARARDLDLQGWVRNRRDGSVEAVFSGLPERVRRMVEECRRGPLDAAVSGIEIMGEGTGAYCTFTVEPTV
jgi:acylphosphatase